MNWRPDRLSRSEEAADVAAAKPLERTLEKCRLWFAAFIEVRGASACNPAETVPCRNRASPLCDDHYSAKCLSPPPSAVPLGRRELGYSRLLALVVLTEMRQGLVERLAGVHCGAHAGVIGCELVIDALVGFRSAFDLALGYAFGDGLFALFVD